MSIQYLGIEEQLKQINEKYDHLLSLLTKLVEK
jgi:hypothetical protein